MQNRLNQILKSFTNRLTGFTLKLQNSGIPPPSPRRKQEHIVLERSARLNLDPGSDHLQEDTPSKWLFARGRPLRMIIYKKLVPPDDHLREAGPSGWLFARGRSIWMVICKKPVHPDDHLQEAGPSGWSFARGWSIQMIICKRPVYPDNHLQEAGPSGWWFAMIRKRLWMIIVVDVVVVVEKEMEENICKRKINRDTDQPTGST